MQRYFSESPYEQGGKWFRLRLLVMSVFSFLLPCFGILGIQFFWKDFETHFHVKLGFLHSVGILSVVGLLYGLFALLLVSFYGPDSLKSVLLRLRGKKHG